MPFDRVAIIGVGLIGGSFALALKQAKACGHVVGVGRNPANTRLAMERGIVDSVATEVSAVADCDLILVATPVAQFPQVFDALAGRLADRTLVTDGGSTKRDVIAAARRALGARLAQFVPAHPIAGGERSGAAAADAGLFRGKRVILTPLPENEASSIEKVAAAWRACGARTSTMPADEHDGVLSTVSHLPHLLAYALAHDVATRPNAARLFEIAGAGFRDFTRIASSHPEMWRDICMANRDRLLEDVAFFEKEMARIKACLESGDAKALETLFTQARDARNAWLNSSS
jgi:prephenate dehydrogenase